MDGRERERSQSNVHLHVGKIIEWRREEKEMVKGVQNKPHLNKNTRNEEKRGNGKTIGTRGNRQVEWCTITCRMTCTS